MQLHRVHRAALLVVLLCSAAGWSLAQPAVFEDVGVREAIEQTKGTDKILIVKATAAWCDPCKRMDATTWVDAAVVRWVQDHGLATRLDVDEQPELAKELGIDAVPTLIAFKQGAEFDRVVGYRDAAGLLAWAEDVKASQIAAQRLRRDVEGGDDDTRVDVRARMERANALRHRGRYDEATDEFIWLWQNMLEHRPSMAGVRLSYMVSDMRWLARDHEPAKRRFMVLRDDLTKTLESQADESLAARRDWIALNEVIDDQATTLLWFDEVKDRLTARAALARLSNPLRNLLIDHGRFEDLAYVQWDPVKELNFMLDTAPQAEPGQAEAFRREELGRTERFAARRAGVFLKAAIEGGHVQHVAPLLEVLDERLTVVDGVLESLEYLAGQGVAHQSLLPPLDRLMKAEEDADRVRAIRAARERVQAMLQF